MILTCVAGLQSFGLAYIVMFVFHDDTNPYPAFGPARLFNWGWMMSIVVRNSLATLIICGFWDWFLYFSPFQVNFSFKENVES